MWESLDFDDVVDEDKVVDWSHQCDSGGGGGGGGEWEELLSLDDPVHPPPRQVDSFELVPMDAQDVPPEPVLPHVLDKSDYIDLEKVITETQHNRVSRPIMRVKPAAAPAPKLDGDAEGKGKGNLFMDSVVAMALSKVASLRVRKDRDSAAPGQAPAPASLSSAPDDVVLTALDEWRCMRAAGMVVLPTGLTVQLPACTNGDQCIARTDWYRGRLPPDQEGRPVTGMTLMAYLTPHEYQMMAERGIKPANPSDCVLCRRYFRHKAVLDIRASGLVFPYEVVVSSTRYVLDAPGGYRSDYCEFPSKVTNDGILYPFPRYDTTTLAWVRDKDGYWWVDQSACVVKGGESALPFQVSS